MRTPFLCAAMLAAFALPTAAHAQQQSVPAQSSGQDQQGPLPISLGRYRLGMQRSELPPSMPCVKDNPEFRQRGDWCTPRPGVGLVIVHDTVAAIWVLSVHDGRDRIGLWRTRWMPRAKLLFGRTSDQVICAAPADQTFGGPLMICAVDSSDLHTPHTQMGTQPLEAGWFTAQHTRLARVLVRDLIRVGPDGRVLSIGSKVAFVLQCWPGEDNPVFTAGCVAPPFR
jgi:hypothetical protein